MTVKQILLKSALKLFTEEDYDAVSISKIRTDAGVSNGSFFHVFPNKTALAAELLMTCVAHYQAAVTAGLNDVHGGSDGIALLIGNKLRWVTENQLSARFLLDSARSQWFALAAPSLRNRNADFSAAINAWRTPLTERGMLHAMPMDVFMATLTGPANFLCRLWLAGMKPDLESPLQYEDHFVASACRALVTR